MRFYHPIFTVLLGCCAANTTAQQFTIEPVQCNTRFNEFAPVVYREGIVYCSDKPNQFGIKWMDQQGNEPTKIYYNADPSVSKSTFLSPSFNTHFNEGPVSFSRDGNTVFYTGTLPAEGRRSKAVMGLFISEFNGKEWSEPIAFEHNSTDQSFTVAHPCLNRAGDELYFVSDLPGGSGGMDIYRCKKNASGWSTPENMGVTVNSKGDELFPFLAESDQLYFTTAKDSLTGLDIYVSYFDKGVWQKPEKLSAPVNTEFDDFSYVAVPGGESGYFSSNRNGTGDDLFKFEYVYPTFEGCPPAEQPTFCYLFEELNIVPNDSTHFLYEWELGDGNKAAGLSVEHCYEDFGQYHIALNVYDSLTKAKFARISELDLEIAKSPFPWITAADSVNSGKPLQLSAEGTDIAGFEGREYYWSFGDGRHHKAYKTEHLFESDGIYDVQLGIFGINTETGAEEKRCATKRIVVGNPELPADSLSDENTTYSSLHEDMYFPEAGDSLLLYEKDSTVYFVEFHQSPEQLSLDDAYFNNIKYEITERYNEEETMYKYSVGNTTELNVLIRIYNDLIDKGYDQSLVRELKSDEFSQSSTKKWWFLPDSLASAINTHLNKFNDIQFNKDDFAIRKESYDNLDYIAQVMIMEPDINLKVMAHTDSIGTSEHNLKLSQLRAQEVVNYFVSKGISEKRLIPEGYGENVPIVSNGTEEGRSTNRRVSFEIVLEKPNRKAGR